MRLALIDGTNAVMRRAMVQTDLPKERIVAGTVLNILDFVREVKATHLVVCFDSRESGRRRSLPAYKADRETDTGPWAGALLCACAERGIRCLGSTGFEADDVIATLTARAKARAEVVVLSSDNDLLVLAEAEYGEPKVRTFQYKKGGGFVEFSEADVLLKLPALPKLMPAYNALVGGKNGAPGVPGYGKKKAAALLLQRLDDWVQALPEHEQASAFHWTQVLTLCTAAPLPRLTPSDCSVEKIRAGVPLATP